MNWKRSQVLLGALVATLLLAAVSGCVGQKAEEAKVNPTAEKSPAAATPAVEAAPTIPTDFSEYIIETNEFAEILGQPNLVILSGRLAPDYQEAHIAGAVNLRWRDVRDLDTIIETGFPMTSEKAEELFGNAGIDANTRVVVYAAGDGRDSTGVWFALKFFGHDNVQVLNGGLRKWVEEGRQVTDEPTKVEKKTFVAKPRPEMVVTADYVVEKKDTALLMDARSFNEIVGIDMRLNPRGGHIPWAKWLEWKELGGDITLGELGTFKSPEVMQKVLQENGVTRDKETIIYCDSGQRRASINYMVMKMLGYDNVKIYMGSFIDWSQRLDLSVETAYKR